MVSGVALSDFRAVLETSAGSSEELALSVSGDAVVGTFRFLAPGDYTVDLVAPANVTSFNTAESRPAAVSVGSGQAASVAFTLSSVSTQ